MTLLLLCDNLLIVVSHLPVARRLELLVDVHDRQKRENVTFTVGEEKAASRY